MLSLPPPSSFFFNFFFFPVKCAQGESAELQLGRSAKVTKRQVNKDGDDGEKKKNLKPVTRSNRETTARRTNKHLKSRDRLVRGDGGIRVRAREREIRLLRMDGDS